MGWYRDTSNLIDRIYDCVLHDGEWEALMWEISRKFGCRDTFYFLYCVASSQFLDGAFYRCEKEWQRGVEPVFFQERPSLFERELLRPFGSILAGVERYLWKEDRFRLLTTHPISSELIVGFSLQRCRSREAFKAEDMQHLQQLLLHVARALRIKERIDHLEANTHHIAGALNQVPAAAILVDKGLRVFGSNLRAEELLAQSGALSYSQGRLIVSGVTTRQELLAAIKESLISDEVDPTSPPIVEIRRSEKMPLKVIPMSLRAVQGVGRSSRVMLLIYDPEANFTINAEYLERLFDLTSTETFVAARLAEGLSISEIAELRRCSTSTVRTHVKRLFQKTETSRQGELVQLILTSPAISLRG